MKTLVILAHPNLSESGSQQFLVNAIKDHKEVTVHHLDKEYPDGIINRQIEQELLQTHDRIIFQFPFYWYSAPAILKEWQDVVFAGVDFYQHEGTLLKGKEFGLVLTIGVKESDYRAGGREGFTIDELTRPYQAVARHMEMTYLTSFAIHQFAYLSESEKKQLLVNYQYYLTGIQPITLENRTNWLVNQLKNTSKETLPTEKQEKLETLIAVLIDRQELLTDLKMTLKDF